MAKICAKCEKSVYPIEELKCLDKVWHKGCFRCTECGMTLNMKNYKGFNKFPYCNAHYPQTKHTVVADTPEMQRLSQASKLQSQCQYHNDFKKSLGRYTQIADDQEMNRLRKNQQTFSMAKYHEEFEKKIKGSKIQVADDPETQRLKQLSNLVSEVEYRGLREKFNDMETKRHLGGDDQKAPRNDNEQQQQHQQHQQQHQQQQQQKHQQYPSYNDRNSSHSVSYTGQGKVEQHHGKVGSINDYDPSISNQSRQWQETHPFNPVSSQQSSHQTRQASSVQHQGMVCKAMYSYTAQDTDEVGFNEGDVIIQCEPIDEGWMYGTVQKSGQRGMLPSNYVEKL